MYRAQTDHASARSILIALMPSILAIGIASVMDQLVNEIRRLSSSGEFKTLATQLQSSANVISATDAAVLDSAIECLDCRQHSLGVMAALVGKLSRYGEVNWPTLLAQMRAFLENFSLDQVRESPLAFCNLVHRFTELACLQKKALQAIAMVTVAIERYAPTPGCLTALHADLLQLCLVAKCLKPALPFLEREYTQLLTELSQFDVKYVLLFYYYGGMVYSCLHQYLKALLYYTVCLTMPTVAISAIMVAAYKKFIVVSLLKFGKVIALPRYSSHIIERVIKPLCGPYTELAKCYTSAKAAAIQAVITKYSDTFAGDNNTGLVLRLVACIHRNSVQRLTLTFMTLGLVDVASRVGLAGTDEAEKYIRDMVEDDEIYASLNQVAGMVSFMENPENYDSILTAMHMDSQLSACMALERKLSAFDQEMALDPRYIHRSVSSGVDEEQLFHDEAVA